MSDLSAPESLNGLEIAIIGVAGRFPGAKNIAEFWQNLKNGVESISFFSDEELTAAGENPALVQNPHYIRAKGILSDVESFDANLFGFFPKEAEILDPQHRHFLECAWEALEDAGYDSERYPGLIGVFAGVAMNTYIMNYLYSKKEAISTAEGYQLTIGSDKDFLTTKVSYKLNLRGPSIDIQTACSTSLTAIYLACQSLVNYQCDMALAGGSSIGIPQQRGYLYQEGMILSADGHCRAFDANASGTTPGNGVGLILLKRLTDALEDGDHIYAIIKGAACNNDGSQRVGFTAPGVEGQAEVIAMAQAVANVEPDTISYIETHGTGTTLGDPIEIAALTQVFRERTDETGFCAVGAVKANVGHLDAAAGVTGLIKTALALHHRQLPPSINFEKPNPKIDFRSSPFYVNTKHTDWKTERLPRRAGVSSFGIGGTNVHVVLEEAPVTAPFADARSYQLLSLSAKTNTALDKMISNLTTHLQQHPEVNIADVAYTNHIGRRQLNHRFALVCQTYQDALAALTTRDPERIMMGAIPEKQGEQAVVFMFSGQGAQYVNMGLELYQTEQVFREQIDFCSAFLKPLLGFELKELLYPPESASLDDVANKLSETYITQPALFVIEYALAKLWLEWGIVPQAMIGHSIGEYVAACLAGVFSLEDALTLVFQRGRLMQSMPAGAMLSVPLDEQQLLPLLTDELDLAAINAPSLCVVSGSFEAIEKLENQLQQKNIDCRRLHTSHAFHSKMMEPILNSFTELVQQIKLNAPEMPFISNVSGTWITVDEATAPQYWAAHIRRAVRFATGIEELLDDPARVFLEVGPGKTLSTLARRVPSKTPGRVMLSSLRHPQESGSDVAFALSTLGKLWLAGAKVDWFKYYASEKRRRISLPTYPFDRQRYWLEAATTSFMSREQESGSRKKGDLKDWFYLPSWKRKDIPAANDHQQGAGEDRWLFFVEKSDIGSKIMKKFTENIQQFTVVFKNNKFDRIDENVYSINPESASDYVALIQDLKVKDKIPTKIVCAMAHWNIDSPAAELSFAEAQLAGFYSLIYLAQALAKENISSPLQLTVFTTNLYDVIGQEILQPEKATIIGPCKVIPQEYPNIICRIVDLDGTLAEDELASSVFAELAVDATDMIVAYRGRHRWIQTYEPHPVTSEKRMQTRLREHGVYFITGGLGRIGLTFAEYLAQNVQAKLVLVDLYDFPAKTEWEQWLQRHGEADGISQKINRLRELERAGAEILVARAEVADAQGMKKIIDQTLHTFGKLNGVIHAAGIVGERALKAIQEINHAHCEEQFQAKVYGLQSLEKALHGIDLDFCILQSSLSSILGGLAMTAYAAANCYMDAFMVKHNQLNSQPWISVNWEGWLFDEDTPASGPGADIQQLALKPAEGVQVLEYILATNGLSQIIVSTGNLQARIERWVQRESMKEKETAEKPKATSLHPRPNLPNPYVAPRNELEQEIVATWQELLGIEQIGIYDSFFELGGHSLLATQLVSRMRDIFKVELPLRNLFESPKVATLSEIIEKSRSDKMKIDTDVSALLQLVEQMSDDEARAVLDSKKEAQ